MATIRNYFGDDVSAVQVFYAPRIDKWVLRVASKCGLLHGDLSVDVEPTDEELRAAFGDIKILRGYSIVTLVDEMGTVAQSVRWMK